MPELNKGWDQPWQAPDMTAKELDEVKLCYDNLGGILPTTNVLFHTREDIEALDMPKAMTCLRYARRMLLSHLLMQEFHEHMLDDCGDYLTAASDNWDTLYSAYWDNDGDPQAFVAAVKAWLLDANDLGGCDGEIRMDIVSEDLQNTLYYPEGGTDA